MCITQDPLPMSFEGPEQGFVGINCQNASQGKPCIPYVLEHVGLSKLCRARLDAAMFFFVCQQCLRHIKQ